MLGVACCATLLFCCAALTDPNEALDPFLVVGPIQFSNISAVACYVLLYASPLHSTWLGGTLTNCQPDWSPHNRWSEQAQCCYNPCTA